MANDDRTARVGFRFWNLSKEGADALQAFATAARQRPQRGLPGKHMVSLPWLEPEGDYEWITAAIQRFRLPESDYGVFISLVTRKDTDIVEMRAFALSLSRRVGGQIEFSFTCVGEDDDEESPISRSFKHG